MIKNLRSFFCNRFRPYSAIFLFVFVAFSSASTAQQVLYATNFGNSSTALGTLQANWTAGGANPNYLQLEVASQSTAYTSPITASASANLVDNGGAAGSSTATLAGAVNTTGFNTIRVLFGIRNSGAYAGTVTLEWSPDGTTWNAIAFTAPPLDGNWYLANSTWINLPAGAENQGNLRFRFTYNRTSGVGNIRVDDFTVLGTLASGPTLPAHYFRSLTSGNWEYATTWQSSADNATWVNASLAPTSAAAAITVQSPHTVTINDASSGKTIVINSGATLSQTNGVAFTLLDAAGTDLTIFGTFVLNGSIPTAGASTYSVENGGTVRVASNASPGLADDFVHTNANILFKTGSVYDWATNNAFQSSGNIYFNSATEYPTFRLSSSTAVGANTPNNTTINGFFEVAAGFTATWQNTGIRFFRDGFGGAGNINLTSGSIQVTGINLATTRISGTGTTTISGTSTGVFINNLAQVTLNSNYTVNGAGFNFTVSSGGWLNCGTNVLSGTSNFVLASGGRLGIGSTAGINSAGATGNIQTTGRSFSSSADYLYNNGTADQSTGTFTTTPTANTVNSLNISNTGFTVTLSAGNNNLTATSLYLNTGSFEAGTGQNINIANGGTVFGNGGTQPNNNTAGTITFVAGASVSYTNGLSSGQPALYSVILNCGVDFNGNPNTQSATIMNSLLLNAGSFVTDGAPFYQSGSTLIYNNGGTFNRNVEWGNTAGLQGYPHHITVQNGTTLQLNTNAIAPAQLATGGNLTLGNSTSTGIVNMNNAMAKPLSVGGNLVIGNTNAASNGSTLNLSTTIGGDLWLYGNFERWDGSFYNENTRAIFFKGGNNATISTPNVTITPGVPTQLFAFPFIDKNSGSQIITLLCPVGVTNQIDFTNGVVTSTATNLLVLNIGSSAVNGSASSFVNGPMKKIGTTAFTFPVGKIVGSVNHYRTIGISAPGAGSHEYTAEFWRADPYTQGSISSTALSNGLQRISRCEYWDLTKSVGAPNVGVTLSWDAISKCNVGQYIANPAGILVVQYNGTQWGDTFGRTSNTTGTVTWTSGPSLYNKFVLGSNTLELNPLPFTLSLFKATGKNGTVLLNWYTNTNDLAATYTIERSSDGIRFEKLISVNAVPQVSDFSYAQTDASPFNGWNYYRLRTIDQKGETFVSFIEKVWMGSKTVIQLSPVPAKDVLNVYLGDAAGVTEMSILNSKGQLMKQVKNIKQQTQINVNGWQPGLYILRVVGKNSISSHSFIKQ